MKNENIIGTIKYLIVGNGDMHDALEQMRKKYALQDLVAFLGYRSDIDELCKTVDCFVHPSIREGLGIAPLEAMAAGLPLISANVNGMKDYTKNSISGCCIDPMNVDEMVEAIRKMYEDSEFRKKCAANNLKTVKSYDLRKTEEIMKKIYG